MTKVLSGTFQISGWDEKPSIEHDDGAKQSHAKMTQCYSGDVQGSGDIQYLMCYQSAGSALFVGFEMVTGSLHGQSGSFVMQHTGQFVTGVASSNFVIVANSGKGQFAGLSGQGNCRSGENAQAHDQLTVTV